MTNISQNNADDTVFGLAYRTLYGEWDHEKFEKAAVAVLSHAANEDVNPADALHAVWATAAWSTNRSQHIRRSAVEAMLPLIETVHPVNPYLASFAAKFAPTLTYDLPSDLDVRANELRNRFWVQQLAS